MRSSSIGISMFIRICLIFLLVVPEITSAKENNVFMSILSSNNFQIPAKVFAYKLKKLHPNIPFVMVVTQDISEEVIDELKQRQIEILHLHKIMTPFADTHDIPKHHYTKINLWALTNYTSIVYLDLDILPVGDVSMLFKCGSFCAVIRQADLFNAGMLVLKPNITIYKDMLENMGKMYSYDKADQGFFNTYFGELKYAPMFNDEREEQRFKTNIMRLNLKFNWDIGAYYLHGEKEIRLDDAKLIHFTLGPVKPWNWWAYPIFHLNNLWIEARNQMETEYNETNHDFHLLLFEAIFIPLMILMHKLATPILKNLLELANQQFAYRQNRPYTKSNPTLNDSNLHELNLMRISYLCILSAFFISWSIMPNYPHPNAGWAFFTINMATISIFFYSLYTTVLHNQSASLSGSFITITLLLLSVFLSIFLICAISTFSTRCLTAVSLIALNFAFLTIILRKFAVVFPNQYTKVPLQ